jgi:hypothetical protein
MGLDSWRSGEREGLDCTLVGCGSSGCRGLARSILVMGLPCTFSLSAATYHEAWRELLGHVRRKKDARPRAYGVGPA